MLEIRFVDEAGTITKTANEKKVPKIVNLPVSIDSAALINKRRMILTDHCFDGSGRVFLKWVKDLTPDNVAAVFYEKDGRIRKCIVAGKENHDPYRLLKIVSKNPMTFYNQNKGTSSCFIYLPIIVRQDADL